MSGIWCSVSGSFFLVVPSEVYRVHLIAKDARPSIPNTPFTTPHLLELLRVSWHRDPAIRPPFPQIVRETHFMYEQSSNGQTQPQGCTLRRDLSRSSIFATMWDWESHKPRYPSAMGSVHSNHGSLGGQADSVENPPVKPVRPGLLSRCSSSSQRSHRRSFSSSSTTTVRMPEPMFYTPPAPSHHPSFSHSPLASPYAYGYQNDPLHDVVGPAVQGRFSPPPPPYDLKKHRRTSSHSGMQRFLLLYQSLW